MLRRPLLLLILLSSLVAASSADAAVSSTADDIAATDGSVETVLRTATRTYVGGSFAQVGRPSPGGAGLDAATGALKPALAVPTAGPAAAIYAVVDDGNGGFYVGGAFTAIAGATRTNLAHINADGTLDTTFVFNTNTGTEVDSLVRSGTTLFVGGTFTSINGTAIARLAKINLGATPTLDTSFTPSPASGTVSALAVTGTTLYAGGTFSSMGGVAGTANLAKLTTAGTVDQVFKANPNAAVSSLAVTSTAVYAGGDFTTIGVAAFASTRVAKLDPATGLPATGFTAPAFDAAVQALVLTGNALYVGGLFSTIGNASTTTPYLTRVDATSGTRDASFAPAPDKSVYSLALTGTSLYVGGAFLSIGGQNGTRRLALVDTTTGTVTTAFKPSPTAGVNAATPADVRAIAVTGSTVYAGGLFRMAGGVLASNLAALNLDGTVDTAFLPNPNSTVYALAASGSTLYVGGGFTAIGGSSIPRFLARLNAAGVVDTNWLPYPSNSVFALALTGSTLYAGGSFQTVATPTTQAIPKLVKLKTTGTGSAGTIDSTFNAGFPTAGSQSVEALAILNDRLYVGGGFQTVSGVATGQRLAKFSPAGSMGTTQDLTFSPAPDGTVIGLAASGDTLYAGGGFATISGQTATPNLAKFTGAAGATGTTQDLTYAPTPSATSGGTVFSVLIAGSSLYVGGNFTTIGGGSRSYLARLTAAGTLDTSFAPAATGTVTSLAQSNTTVAAGGAFSSVNGANRSGFAQFSDPTPQTAVGWRGGTARALRRGGVRVTWRTGVETDNLGFDVLRARRGVGRRVEVTKRLVPGGALTVKGPRSGYRFVDRSGRRGDRYFVVDRDLRGRATVHAIGAAR